MRTYVDCIPCLFDQALRAARMVTEDEQVIKRVMDEIGEMLHEIPLGSPVPEAVRLVYAKVTEITGNIDPCTEIKQKSTNEALEFYPYMKGKISASRNRLESAIALAIAGNAIDFGPNHRVDIKEEIKNALERDLDAYNLSAFKTHLEEAQDILYIGDNAGETVFDRLLIEELDKRVVYAVRESPVINDATYEDALHAGLDKVAQILSSGADTPGAVLERCSPEFNKSFHDADVVISKGQGNYEALSDESRSIFFLFKVKCKVVADLVGTSEGEMIIKGINI